VDTDDHPVLQRHRDRKELFSQTVSTYFIFLDLGIAVGPYFLGFIVPGWGYRGVYGTAAILTFLCIPLYYRSTGEEPRQNAARATRRRGMSRNSDSG
jgi:MFS family permease